MAAPELGHRHPEARRLRELLHDPAVRRNERAFVLEGPRLVGDALDRGAEVTGGDKKHVERLLGRA